MTGLIVLQDFLIMSLFCQSTWEFGNNLRETLFWCENTITGFYFCCISYWISS